MSQPTEEEAKELLAKFREAEAAIPQIVEDRSGYPVYPKPINEFTRFISLSAWSRTDYSAFPLQELKGRIEEVNLDEVRALLTLVIRMERFSPGGLKTLLDEGSVEKMVGRAVQLTTTNQDPLSS
ncbi:MAG: hypothetical protein CMO55_20625 [Verrucomicrobiales bacterium]|nr:hypothetical protein [Verrucomicrobiales bacterium]